MRKTTLIALAAALLVSAAACHKDHQAEQLAALDEAYKSGVFSKEEYDARKQAIVGQAKAPAAPPQSGPAAAPVAAPDQPQNTPASNPPDSFGSPGGAASPAAAAPAAPGQPAVTPAPAPSAAATSAPQSPVAQPPAPEAQAPPRSPAAPAGQMPRSPAAPPVQPQRSGQTNGADREEPEPAPLAGCEDAESKSGGAKGVQERFFPASVEAVRKAAAIAMKNLDFTIHVDSGPQMEASKRRHFGAVVGAGGERLILHFERSQRGGQSGTRVTGETKKSFVGRLAQKSWTSAVLAQIACNLRTGRY